MTPDMIQRYSILVEFLGNALGPDYEIVLHDLGQNNNAIVAIVNGHISGRSIGSPLTNTALQLLAFKSYENNHFLCNYKGVAENGHILRSSTMFIKGRGEKPVGLLCINFDDSRYLELHNNLLSVVHPQGFLDTHFVSEQVVPGIQTAAPALVESMTENFPADIHSLMEKIFEDVTSDSQMLADRLNQYDKIEIVKQLDTQGLFQLKGAIPFVAKKLGCSAASVYRYLGELKR